MENPLLWFALACAGGVVTGSFAPVIVAAALAAGAMLVGILLWIRPASYPDGGRRGLIAVALVVYAVIASPMLAVRF
jgi:hypothetical protein